MSGSTILPLNLPTLRRHRLPEREHDTKAIALFWRDFHFVPAAVVSFNAISRLWTLPNIPRRMVTIMRTVHIYEKGILAGNEAEIVREFPLVLQVNGRELATLIASPHDLRYLVAGFLRLQGFVTSLGDFHILSVCEDYGIASVRIKGELPERLRPVLTSGCGTGITFTLDEDMKDVRQVGTIAPVDPVAVFRLMEGLARQAEGYRRHGGMHSAAVGTCDGCLLLSAEDIGRHNTLDRIAGEALLKEIDLAGKLLVTSGRVSAELAAKAVRLGIPVIASRTAPTDMAITICLKAGITLIGYVRGSRFTVYTHPERLAVALTTEVGGISSAEGRKGREAPS